MKKKKLKVRKIILASCVIICLLISAMIAFGLSNYPTNYQSEGVNIDNWSHFVGNVPGNGKYKVKKGQYVQQAWVRVQIGSSYDSTDWSEALTKTSKKLANAEIKKFNNPLTKQKLTYGWKFNR